MNIHRYRLALLFALVFTFVLAGCSSSGGDSGGNSSGGSSSSSDARLINQLVDYAENHFSDIARQAAIAATSIPRAGSVTQSSNVDGSNITLDQVEATASYNDDGILRVSVTNSRTGSWGTISTSDTLLISSNDLVGSNTGTPVRRRSLAKRIGNGAVAVDVFTNRLQATDTDYLVGGIWLFVPNLDTPTGLAIGAFMDGPAGRLTPATYLQTTATANYQGDARGVFLETNSEYRDFVADVALTANFRPTNPSISGRMTNFQEIDVSGNIIPSITGNPVLTLGAALIGTTSGGFFTGDTGGTQVVGGVGYTYSGKWGGQFYGDQANYIGGTFGGNTKNNPGDPSSELSFVGVFGAFRN